MEWLISTIVCVCVLWFGGCFLIGIDSILDETFDFEWLPKIVKLTFYFDLVLFAFCLLFLCVCCVKEILF